jgi:hypothetical protein
VAVLILAIIGAILFAFFRGGLTYPLQPLPGAAVSSSPAARSLAPVALASASPVPASVAPSPSPPPSPSPSPTPSPTPRPTPKPTPRPTSDRFAVLRPCPQASDCWIYVIRSGDNLFSIAHWFGVSLARIEAMNPWTRTTGLRAGQELKIPTPTR